RERPAGDPGSVAPDGREPPRPHLRRASQVGAGVIPGRPGTPSGASLHDGPSGDAASAHPAIGDVVEVSAVETVVRLDGRAGRLEELVVTADVVQSLSAVLEKA